MNGISTTTSHAGAGVALPPMSPEGRALNAQADALITSASRTLGGHHYVDTEDLARAVYAQRSDGLTIAVQARLTPTQRGEFARALDRAEGPSGFLGQVMGANGDFLRNYDAMREANTIGADKYFHCKANSKAAQRGTWGEARAAAISDMREWVDQMVKGDPASASAADQVANAHGRSQARIDPGAMGREACHSLRPQGLDARY